MLMSFLRAQDGNRFWSAAGRRGSRGTAAVLAVVAMLVTSLGSASTALASTGSAVPAASIPVAASVPVAPKAAAAPAGPKLAAGQNLAAAPQALAAATGFATGGTGKYPGSIEWFEWGTDGELIPTAGLTKTNTRTVAGKALATTCTISAPTGQLKAYRSGDFGGDGLDDMYNVGGAGTSNQMVAGIANYTQATQVGFDFTCSVTLAGVSVPLAGLVMADAEASTNVNEYVSATASAGATWRLIDRYRSAGCTADQNVTRSGLTLTFAGAGTACPTYPTGVAFMEGATSAHVTVKGGGVSAVALGVMLFTDFGDAPQSYGDAGALYSPAFTGGAIPAGSSTLFGTNTLAALGQASPRLGAATTAEQAPQPSAAANLDADDALTAPLSITASQGNTYTLPGIAATGGTVRGWIDWNRNGAFDAGEASSAVAPSGGTVALTWTVPADATGGPTYLRLRTGANATAVSSPVGLTTSGEVEDFAVTATVLQRLTCTSNEPGLLFQGAPTTEYAINLVTGSSSTVKSNLYPQNVNGVGYNVLDGYLYGNTTNAAPFNIVRIGAGGAAEVVGPQPTGAAGFVMGDVDANGHYWIMTGATWYEIDLVPGSPTYLGVIASGTAAAPTGIALGFDWAYVPGGGDYLYATGIVASNNLASLVRFNMTTHQWENRGYLGYPSVTPTGAVEGAGAVYADADGHLYASYNTSGRIFRIDVNPSGTSTGALFSQGPASATNDGARCAQSAIRIDFGDAASSYGTLLQDNGPRHAISDYDATAKTAPLMIGAHVDADQDGHPTATATGDDADATDDEDAFSAPVVLNPGSTTATLKVPVTNGSGGPATLYGWIDANRNGTFEPNEFASVAVPNGATSVDLAFAGLTPLQDGTTPAIRLRLTTDVLTDDTATPTDDRAKGVASNGEVEDHLAQVATIVPISCVAPFTETFGTGPNYSGPLLPGQTTYLWENGAGVAGTPLGNKIVGDGEYSLISSLGAGQGAWWHTGTDHTGDPNGLMMLVNASFDPGIFFQRTFANLSAGATYDFSAWLTNGDRVPVQILPDVTFRVIDPATGNLLATVDTGDIPLTSELEWNRYGLTFKATTSMVRLEIVNNAPGGNGNDLALDDITFSPVCEFGDAPDSYGTTLANDGAAHVATGPTLGTKRDTESDGQPTTGADGDDVAGIDDEDGVGAPLTIVRGSTSTVKVSATNDTDGDVTLAGWVDLDGDGTFDDAERVVVTVPANSGAAEYELTFPAGTITADTYARFRIYGEVVADPRPTGIAFAGEVEDYRVTVLVEATLQVLKVGEDSTGTVVPMDGSAWAVYTQETGGNAVVASIAPAVDGGGASITGLFRDTLAPGTYWLEETKALPGFELLAGRVPFTVAPDGAVALGATASANVTVVDIDGVRTIRVEDVPKLELPDAGGFGTLPIYLAGALLLAVAAAIATASAVRRHKASQRVQGRNQ